MENLIIKLKKIYWLFESFSYEYKVRLFNNKKQCLRHTLPNKLVISLTSYAPRFKKLNLTLKCLLQQNIRADLVVLWLTKDDFKSLPKNVLCLQKHKNFKIHFSEDIKSYKKIIPALKEYPDAFIVTADDDLYYPNDWLKRLTDVWDGDYKNIVSHRVHGILYDKNKLPKPYRYWPFNIKKLPSPPTSCLPTGGAGSLYPPNSLDSRVMDSEVFLDLCSNADDIWLFWMARLNGSYTTKALGDFNLVCWLNSQEIALAHDNLTNNENDQQIKNLINKYGWPIEQ